MTLDQFSRAANIAGLREADRVCYLAFFYFKTKGITEFSVAEAARWLVDAGGASPNLSRLNGNLRPSRNTIRAPKGWRLRQEFVTSLDAQFPQLSERSQEIIDDGTILPEALYGKTRGYIESLAKQINASYEHNIFDGCAVLMCRLEEVLLVLSYEKLGIEASVKDGNGNYLLLEGIVRNAVSNTTLSLSRNSKASVETFRELGNYSAHKITYTCKREYIKQEIGEYRALVDELLHKSGLRV